MSNGDKKCPNCGTLVGSAMECPRCGTNVKTGQSFQARVKQNKQRTIDHGKFRANIIFMTLLAVGLIGFAGFMYQRSVAETIADNSEIAQEYARRIQQADALVQAGRTEDAIERYKTIAEELKNEIKQPDDDRGYSRRTDVEEQERKEKQQQARASLLRNLRAKAIHKREALE